MSLVNSPLFEWFFSGCCVLITWPKNVEVGGRSSTLTLGAFGKGNRDVTGCFSLVNWALHWSFANWEICQRILCLNGKRDKFDRNLQVWWLMIDVCHVSVFPSNEFNLHSATQKFINKNTRWFTWWKYRRLYELVSFFHAFLSVIFWGIPGINESTSQP